jgi:hypothetical protein
MKFSTPAILTALTISGASAFSTPSTKAFRTRSLYSSTLEKEDTTAAPVVNGEDIPSAAAAVVEPVVEEPKEVAAPVVAPPAVAVAAEAASTPWVAPVIDKSRIQP